MAIYPGAIATDSNLFVAVNGIQTTLAATINSTTTTIQLTSVSGFPTTGYVTIDNSEIVLYTGISGSNLTGCTRGSDGTTAASHNLGVTVGATIVAAHHNLLKDEIEAIETALGANLSNVFPATPTTGTGNVVLQTSPTINSPTLTSPTLGTPASGVLTNATGLPLTTGVTGVLPNGNTTATSSPTASDIVSRDSNGNTQVNTIVENFSTTATAAGTTTLTAASSPIQQFTGTTTQTVTLPDATTLTVGYQITVLNRSTGTVSVNNNGGSLQKAIAGGSQNTFTVTSISTANGVWDVSSSGGTGTVTSVSGTTNQITSTNPTTTPVLALASPLIPPGAITGVDGTVSAPAISFSGDTDAGLYRIGADDIALATNGVKQLEVSTTTISAKLPVDLGSNKITSLANGTASADAAAFGQIKYLQAVQNSTTTSFTTSSTSYVDVTNHNVAITPTSASNRVKLTFMFVAETASAGSAFLTLLRGSTDLGAANGFAQVFAGDGDGFTTITIVYIDSPATTSSTTYKLQVKMSGGSATIGKSNVASVMIAEEVV